MDVQWYLLMTALWFSVNILSFLWAKWATQIKLMEIVAGNHVWLRIRDPWVECPLRVVARAIHADTSVTWRISAHLWQVAAMRLPSFTCGVACLLMLPEGHTTAVPDTTIKVILFHFRLILYSFHYSLLLSFLPQLLYFFYVFLSSLPSCLFYCDSTFFGFIIYWHVYSVLSFSLRHIFCSFLRFFLSFTFLTSSSPVEAHFQIAMFENCAVFRSWKYSPNALTDPARVFTGGFVERWSFDTRTVA